jgi:hypothetical protein
VKLYFTNFCTFTLPQCLTLTGFVGLDAGRGYCSLPIFNFAFSHWVCLCGRSIILVIFCLIDKLLHMGKPVFCLLVVGRGDSFLVQFGFWEEKRGFYDALTCHSLDLLTVSHQSAQLSEIRDVLVFYLADASGDVLETYFYLLEFLSTNILTTKSASFVLGMPLTASLFIHYHLQLNINGIRANKRKYIMN